jgi:hypothetical protein
MRFAPTLVALAAVCAATASQAMTVNVNALANSSSGGIGLETLSLTAGQAFIVSVDPLDLWSAGDLPRWSNADGLDGDLFATGSDESTASPGEWIGKDFGVYSKSGFSAPYGALVGQVGASNFFFVGTTYAGTAAASGMLKLFYWDSNAGDNSQFITANVSAVPEPGTYALLLAGLAATAAVSRRRA